MKVAVRSLFGLMSVLFASNAFAQTAIYSFRDLDRDQTVEYVDFSAVTSDPNHYQWLTFAAPGGTVKYKDMKLRSFGGSSQYICLEYGFYRPNNTTVDTDVVLWANVNTGTGQTWQILSDDASGVYPLARVSIHGSINESPPYLRLAPYYSSGNSGNVMVRVTNLHLTQQQCEDPATYTGALFKYEGKPTIVRVK